MNGGYETTKGAFLLSTDMDCGQNANVGTIRYEETD